MAAPLAGALPLTGDILIDSMTTGYRWNNDGPIYFSFSDGLAGEYWLDPTFVESQLRFIFSIFDYYVAADFSYLGYFSSPIAAAEADSNINIALDGEAISEAFGNSVLAIGLFPSTAFAESFLGPDYYTGAEGDVYLNINSEANYYGYDAGEAGFSLALHEIGHALGLKHPHDDGGTAHPTFKASGIDSFDIDWLTIMSYDDDYSWNTSAYDPGTPMVLDVIALQYLYGANTQTNAGDDVFLIQSDTDYYATIFDASGYDRIDLSGYQEGAYIDLPKYYLSDYQYAPVGLVTSLADRDDISIGGSPHSLTWILADIEEVFGSPFGDLIDGSDAAEKIAAGDGFDEIYVRGGDDFVDGGAGPDWVYFYASYAECTVSFEGEVCIVESELDGRNTLTNVEALIFDWDGTEDFREVSDLKAALASTEPPPADNWQLIAGDGQFVSIGGSGQVFGTQVFQSIRVVDLPGTVILDPSFNRGNNLVFLTGDASDWQARLSGSNAVLTDGDTFVIIPVGTVGLHLDFDDGQRLLRFDTSEGAVRIGDYTISEASGQITAAAQDLPFPTGYDAQAEGRLLMTQDGAVLTGGNLAIFGADGSEDVTLLSGSYVLDPSFNRGGDIAHFVGNSTLFEASRIGSSVLIESEDYEVLIPVGAAGMDLSFFNATGTLFYDIDAANVMIGSQIITSTPAPLTFA